VFARFVIVSKMMKDDGYFDKKKREWMIRFVVSDCVDVVVVVKNDDDE